MKKKYLSLLLLCLSLLGCKTKEVVELDYLPIADPYVMLYEGKYYAYGTGGTVEGEGFACFSSDDLKNWRRESQALSVADSYGTWGFWAPEVYYVESKKKFYLFYSAEEHICVATADTPQGPFRQAVKQPIWDEKSIDTSLFIDDDGTPYLYFVRFTDGNVIWAAQMNDDLTSIKPETLTECIKVEEPWELSQDKPAKVAEGPSILKKDGVYYLVYSANHFESKNYGVGYATSDSPMGPWKKYAGILFCNVPTDYSARVMVRLSAVKTAVGSTSSMLIGTIPKYNHVPHTSKTLLFPIMGWLLLMGVLSNPKYWALHLKIMNK